MLSSSCQQSDVVVAGARLRVLELFCGIGGCAAAIGEHADVVAAVDIKREALAVYQRNFRHTTYNKTIESLPSAWFAALEADLWWMSPPCQPFTRRGQGRDLDDPRCAALRTVISHLHQLRPRFIALENVPEFAGSQARKLLIHTLLASGYDVREVQLCPSQFGLPNHRPRYYLVAGREQLRQLVEPQPCAHVPLASLLDSPADPRLRLEAEVATRYAMAMDVVNRDDDAAITSCFTSAYGRSPVRSGSYLRDENGLRCFSPREILRLQGFPDSFALPPQLSLTHAWRLVGNSLSLPPTQHALRLILDLSQA